MQNPWMPSERLRKPAQLMQPIEESGYWYPQEFSERKKYVYALNESEISEIMDAVAAVESRGMDIKDITKQDFNLPRFSSTLADIRNELLHGRGFALIRGFPIEGRSRYQNVAAFWGVTNHFARARPQNAKGHLLGHVTNKGASITTATGRGYQSNEALGFHADGCDLTSLFVLQTAKAGGIHKLCSSVAVYNEMLKRRPDLAKEMSFYFYMSRKGVIPPGETLPYFRMPVFSVQDGYFTARGASNTLKRGHQLPGAPPLTAAQEEGIELYQKLAAELSINIEFQRGDMSYSNSHVTLHSRTKFEDWPEPERRRHLIRLWMRVEEDKRPLIPELSKEIERGVFLEGVQLNAALDP
jgi:hypothetical protein